MKQANVIADITQLIKTRNVLFVILLLSLMINIVQGILNVKNQSTARTVVIPSGFSQEFWVNENAVSSSYLSEMARHAAYLVLNVTPKTVSYNHQKLLELVDAEGYGVVNSQFQAINERVKLKNLTTAFYVTEITPASSSMTVDVKGTLKSFIGQKSLTPKFKHYQVKFSYRGAQLKIASFKEVLV